MAAEAAPAPPAVATGRAIAPGARTRLLLEGAIVPTLLRLAPANVAINVLSIAVNTSVDAYFVGRLEPSALGGLALAFPLVMLMQQMANAGMGGAVASAVARALGAGRAHDANALAIHALGVAAAMATLFTVGFHLAGPAIYEAMGGTGVSVQAALAYSEVVFSGAAAYWVLSTLTSIVRGTGRLGFLAFVFVGAEALHVALAPALIAGWGWLPRLGVAGAAAATVISFSVASAVLVAYLRSRGSLVRLSPTGVRPRRALLTAILAVGGPASVNVVLNNLALLLLTGFVARFGAPALAGYGLAVRLEYVQIPLVFGLGAGVLTMVGTNVGAQQTRRAERIAWTAAGLTAAITGGLGLLAAVFPVLWMGVFTRDAAIGAAGASYLRIVGPVHALLGFGLGLQWAALGAGRPLWPFLAGVSRFVCATGGSWIALRWIDGDAAWVFAASATALVLFGAINVYGTLKTFAVGAEPRRRPAQSSASSRRCMVSSSRPK